ncbi:cell wall anchor protein [Micromonospora sp. NPDC049275]|uniref:cell wall anchor protein n=1 Tax=unclassified Micromonospora TaxID=2617518 RepID=UPI003420F37D
MNVRSRVSARIGAAALLAAGAVGLAGAPAQAADTKADLEISVAGTRLAEGTKGKIGFMKVKNNGPGTPSALTVGVDLSGMHDERIISLPLGENCKGGPGSTIECTVPAAQIPGPGETLEFPIFTAKAAVGYDGGDTQVGFFLRSADDTTPDNNIKQVKLEFDGEPGVDLGVVAPDVKTRLSLEGGVVSEQSPLYPGDQAVFVGEIVNQGDTIAKGVEFTVQLPKGATFSEQYDGCEYSTDLRTATCTDEADLIGADLGLLITFPIKVAPGVKAPVALPNGSLVADALGVAPAGTPLPGAGRKAGIENVRMLAKGERVTDVDPTDNRDDFAVIVAAKGGSGGGTGGDDGGLPVTGAKAGLIGGIGVAVLLAGGVMFLVARRRRVVLVAPADERPTA